MTFRGLTDIVYSGMTYYGKCSCKVLFPPKNVLNVLEYYFQFFLLTLLTVLHVVAIKETDREKQLKEEQMILDVIAEKTGQSWLYCISLSYASR